MPDHADRLDPEFFAKVVGRDRSAAGGDQVQYDPLERLPVADTPGDDQVAADDPVVQPQHRPGPVCLNAARHVVGDGLRTSFFVREFEKFVVGERFEPSRDEEAGYPVRPHVLLDAEQGGQRDGGDDLDALRGLFAQERQPAGRAVHFVQQQDAFARVADQAVEHGGHVGAHVRVGVFVDRQGGGSVLQEQVEQPRAGQRRQLRENFVGTRWQPRGRGRNENSVCDTIGQERFMIVFSRGRRSTVFVGCLPAREGNFCRSVCKCFSRRKPFCKINALFRECGGTPGLSVAIASQSVREMWIKCYNFDSAARVLYEKFRYSKNPLYI